MRSTFSGLEIARTGLTISQQSLDVTGHNIANVDTEGYTRQRIIATAYDPNSSIGRFKPVSQSLVGGGARVMILDQIRSSFLDRQYRTENTSYSYWSERTQGLSYVRSYFESVAETTINDSVYAFFESIKTLSLNTVDVSQRVLVQQKGQLLAQNLNEMYNGLIDLQKTQDTSVKLMVDEINTIAQNISDLNMSIYSFELSGNYANDLRDKRNLLLDQLSTLIDIEYEEVGADYDRQLIIRLGGDELLRHGTVNKLTCRSDVNIVDNETEGTKYTPVWETGPNAGKELDMSKITGGKLKATMQLRDADGSLTHENVMGIPYFVTKLNNLARALVENVNKIHMQGWTYPFENNASRTLVAFFQQKQAGSPAINAKNIAVDSAILNDPYNIACSSVEILNYSNSTDKQTGNNLIISEIYELFNAKDIYITMSSNPLVTEVIGSFDSYMTGLTLDVATTMNYSESMMSNKNILALDAETQRYSVSGVSLDEEMTNLIKFQHAYAGASRVINTMDEIIDILINRTGRVGL